MPDKAPIQQPPPSTSAPARRQGRKFAFVEERGGKLRVRWWVCCVSMGVGVLATALVLELFLRIGGWRNEKVWIPAIVAGAGGFGRLGFGRLGFVSVGDGWLYPGSRQVVFSRRKIGYVERPVRAPLRGDGNGFRLG